MDHKTSIQELKEAVKQFCDERDWDQYHNAKDLAIAVSTEASELLTLFRFKSPEEIDEMFSTPSKREAITDEMADVLLPLLRLAMRYDVDLATEFHRKMGKNRTKYPIEKAKGQNRKYTEF